MEGKFDHQNYRDTLADNLRKVEDHNERKEILESEKGLMHDLAKKVHLKDISIHIKKKQEAEKKIKDDKEKSERDRAYLKKLCDGDFSPEELASNFLMRNNLKRLYAHHLNRLGRKKTVQKDRSYTNSEGKYIPISVGEELESLTEKDIKDNDPEFEFYIEELRPRLTEVFMILYKIIDEGLIINRNHLIICPESLPFSEYDLNKLDEYIEKLSFHLRPYEDLLFIFHYDSDALCFMWEEIENDYGNPITVYDHCGGLVSDSPSKRWPESSEKRFLKMVERFRRSEPVTDKKA